MVSCLIKANQGQTDDLYTYEGKLCKGMSPYAFGRWSEGSMRVLAEFQINLAIPKDVYGYFSTKGRG